MYQIVKNAPFLIRKTAAQRDRYPACPLKRLSTAAELGPLDEGLSLITRTICPMLALHSGAHCTRAANSPRRQRRL